MGGPGLPKQLWIELVTIFCTKNIQKCYESCNKWRGRSYLIISWCYVTRGEGGVGKFPKNGYFSSFAKWPWMQIWKKTQICVLQYKNVLWMQQSVQVEKWRAHINPTALQITWIAFCLVTPTTQTGHKKRGAASDAQCNNWCIKAESFASKNAINLIKKLYQRTSSK